MTEGPKTKKILETYRAIVVKRDIAEPEKERTNPARERNETASKEPVTGIKARSELIPKQAETRARNA